MRESAETFSSSARSVAQPDSREIRELRNIGLELRRLRMERGWSLKQFASESKVSLSAIQKIENGKASPSLVTMLRIAEACGKSLDEILIRASEAARTPLYATGSIRSAGLSRGPGQRPADGAISVQAIALAPNERRDRLAIRTPLFAYVLEGQAVVSFAGGRTERLLSHDAMHVAQPDVTSVANPLSRRTLVLCVSDNRTTK